MRSTLLTVALLAATVCAQTPVAPTNEPVGIPRGDNVSGYNVRQSFELGYRWHTVGGDEDMYRSTVNYGNGPRLLSSSLSVNSLEGHGGLFDQIQLNTLGLGNDPYESASLRLEKNRLYRYDLSWRSNAYYNPGLTIAGGEHFMNTVRHLQDHDLTLFPQSSFKLFLGYSSNTQTGPALTTIQQFDANGDVYPLFADVRRSQHEYRLGFEVRLFGFRLNALHGWTDFKDDTPVSLTAPSAGNNPADLEFAHFAPAQRALSRHQSLLARGAVSGKQTVGGQWTIHLRRRPPRLRGRREQLRIQLPGYAHRAADRHARQCGAPGHCGKSHL